MKRRIVLLSALLAALPAAFVHAQVSSFDVAKLGQFDPAASPTTENYSDGWVYTRTNGTKLALIGTGPLAPKPAGVRIVDVTCPSAPVELSTFVPGPSRRVDIKTYLNYAYIVFNQGAGAPGLVIVDLEPSTPIVVNPGYSSPDFKIGHSLWVDGSYLYVFGAEVNLNESNARTLILSLADPANPVEVGRFTGFYLHDGVVRNNRIYGLAEREADNCAAIIDVTNKASPVLLTKFGWPSEHPHSGDLSADGNYWLTTSESGTSPLTPLAGLLRVFDIRDINNVLPVSVYTANPAETVHDAYVVGNLVHVAHNREGYRLVDVANPESPVEIGHYDPSPQTGPQGT